MKKIFYTTLLSLITSALFSQGTIQGKVTSTETGEELIGATVLIKGTTTGSMSDIDGNYRIPNVATGTYQVICSYISFRADNSNVNVKDGEVSTHNL